MLAPNYKKQIKYWKKRYCHIVFFVIKKYGMIKMCIWYLLHFTKHILAEITKNFLQYCKSDFVTLKFVNKNTIT